MDAMTQATQDQHAIEQAFAGAVLINGDYARHNAGWLSPDVFTDAKLGEFWTKILQGSDPIEVGFAMGISAELLGYQQRVTSHLDVNAYAKSLSRSAYLRFMVMGASDLVRAATAGDENEIDIILTTMKSMDSGVTKSMRSMIEVGESLKNRIRQGDISVAFGTKSVDWATGGAERGTLTILAGRPSMGKSSLAFQWAEHQALNLNLKVGFFALEMKAEQMIARRLCHQVKNVDGNSASWQDVRSKQVSDAELDKLDVLIDEYTAKTDGKLQINDDTHTTTSDILRTQMREKYDVIYIDHLGLLKDQQQRGERYDQLLGRIAMALHELAKNTNAVVFCLAQLNRKVEDRANNRPVMSDLQDSGKLEQNADNIILLFRASYYDPNKAQDVDPMELILGKYRDGSRSSNCWVGFDLRAQTFVSMWQEDIDAMIEDGLEQANMDLPTGGKEPDDIPF